MQWICHVVKYVSGYKSSKSLLRKKDISRVLFTEDDVSER